MKKIIKIAVIGGTGKSGRYLVKELVAQGYNLKLLLRNPENLQISSPSIEVVKGDARDYSSVYKLLEGTEVLISTLGQPKGERPIFSEATGNVIRAMGELGIKRYILISGLNVDSNTDKKGPGTKAATDWMKANYPETTADRQVEYELLANSELNWTLVRLPMIELTEERKKMEVKLEDCPGENISAADLADFLIGQISDTSYFQKSPFISNIQ